MTGTESTGCCARTVSGHAVAAPSSVIKSRRRIGRAPTLRCWTRPDYCFEVWWPLGSSHCSRRTTRRLDRVAPCTAYARQYIPNGELRRPVHLSRSGVYALAEEDAEIAIRRASLRGAGASFARFQIKEL